PMKPGEYDRLYLIADTTGASWPLRQAVAEAVRSGVRLVQLREKQLSDQDYLALAREIRALTTAHGARLLINSRVEIAAEVHADGVHLPRGASISDARRVLGPRALIGVSAPSAEELRRAEAEGADFVTLSPVFPTASKPWATDVLGLARFASLVATTVLPVYALGGVQQENARDCLNAGAYGIAVVSSIHGAPDVGEATKRYLRIMAEPQER
ncbi:MAG: thiamine phosphate synthase, partial [Thermomicrobiales bacterium]